MKRHAFYWIIGIACLASSSFAQWQQMRVLNTCHILDFTTIDSTLYAAGDGGIFRSSDNGDDWTQIWSYSSVNCLAVSGNALYAGTTDRGVIESIDGGKSWVVLDIGYKYPYNNVQALKAHDNFVLASIDTYLNRSSDGGITWEWDFSQYDGVISFLLTDSVYYASTINFIGQSLDKGIHWVKAPFSSCCWKDLCKSSPYDFFMLTKLGDIYRWNPSGTETLSLNKSISSLSADNGIVFAGSRDGKIFHSNDNGQTWKQFATNPSSDSIQKIFSTGNIVFISTGGKIFRTEDGGNSWKDVSNGLKNYLVSGYSFSTQGRMLFAGSDHGILSLDKVTNEWKSLEGLPEKVNDLASNDSIFYAGTDNGTYESLDSGKTWTSLDNGSFGATYFTVVADGILFAIDSINNMRYVNGLWQPLLQEKPSDLWVSMLTFIDGRIYEDSYFTDFLSDGAALHYSDTTDLSTDYIAYRQPILYPLYASTYFDNNIFLGGSNLSAPTWDPDLSAGIMYVSYDKGATWNTSDSILPTCIRSLAQSSHKIFAGTFDGVYFSTDFGNSWTRTTGINPTPPILSLAVDDTYLYAGTINHGIWRRPLSQLGVQKENITQTYMQNFPNPFSSNTTISFSLPKEEYITLKIFDILGNQITTLATRYYEAGLHQIDWDTGSALNGVYFCRLQAGEFIQTIKIAVEK